MIIDDEANNVTMLPAPKGSRLHEPNAALEVVHSFACRHGNFQVDDMLGEVECGRCKAKLNPMWVLAEIAREDQRLRDVWSQLRAEIELMKPRLKTKCRHCNQLTPIPTNVTTWDIQARAAEIRRRKP